MCRALEAEKLTNYESLEHELKFCVEKKRVAALNFEEDFEENFEEIKMKSFISLTWYANKSGLFSF